MKSIISIRLKLDDPTKREQFVRGSGGTVQTKIVNLINKNPNGNFDFLIEEDGNKYVQNVHDLLGEVVNIVDENYIAEFTEDDNGNSLILISHSIDEGSLPQQHTVDQLNMVRKKSKGLDIGDRISNLNDQGANIHYMRNPIDSGIESIQDYERSNKKFQPNWNLRRMKPFKGYFYDQSTSDKPNHRKRGRK